MSETKNVFAFPERAYFELCQRTLALLELVVRGDNDLGFHPEDWPVLVNLNGDFLWLPADLLRFLWHTKVNTIQSPAPHFLAETGHYLWIKEYLKPGMIVFDCGANIGIFSTMMAAKVGPSGQVHAFEPDTTIAFDLKRVLTLNNLNQVHLIQAALADRSGKNEFISIRAQDVQRESSHLGNIDHAPNSPSATTCIVETLTIDEYVSTTGAIPDLIKIDVEGAEFLVLEGAKTTIEQHHPDLVIEIHSHTDHGIEHEQLKSFLDNNNYLTNFDGDKTYFASARGTPLDSSSTAAEIIIRNLHTISENTLVNLLKNRATQGDHSIANHLTRVLKKIYTS